MTSDPDAPAALAQTITDAMNPDVDYETLFGPHFAERFAALLIQQGLVRAPPRAAPSEEIGWLVERAQWSPPMWWGGGGATWGWQADAGAALRFARQADAAAFIDFHSLKGLAVATEHVWVSSIAPGKAVQS